MQDQVYQILKGEICDGYYAPGQWLQEKELAAHLHVSRSPVRDALRKLSYDGLVDTIPNKRTFVRVFTAKDIDEVYAFRVLIESYCIRESPPHLTPDRGEKLLECLENLKRTYRDDDLKDYIEHDTVLHAMIITLGGNSLVESTYEKIHSIIQPFRIYSLVSHKRFDESVEEHEGIVNALLAGDISRAESINQRHLTLAKEIVIKYITSREYLSKCVRADE
jgi:DNA-binding GntR family transcriptional regulator